jgi:hypothetical protein
MQRRGAALHVLCGFLDSLALLAAVVCQATDGRAR